MVNVGGLGPSQDAEPVVTMFRASDTWKLSSWPDSELVIGRAALRGMLSKVENEMGKRKLMGPSR